MKKLQIWLPLLFALIMIIGMWVGFHLRENIPSSQGFFQGSKRASLQEVMDLVRTKYVDSVNADSLAEDGIQAMLAHLDPHSIYIPPVIVSEVNEDLKGNFEGIGIEYFIIDDTVHVTNVLEGGPSDKAGLQPGDKFLKVSDSSVAGNHISNDRIKRLLKGESGTNVKVTYLRVNEIKNTIITRGIIPKYAVDASYLIDPETGFIRVNKFSQTTYREFMEALEKLEKQGMKKMILDLRGNGGGVLDESVNMADEFLDDQKLVVYTQGVNSPKREYNCRRPGLFEKGTLVLLVDEQTASASEVLAGAVQDWDRAILVGRRTFGKGLVQEPFELSNGAQLRLTVARYYTPSGRNIQKPYNKGREAYNEDLMNRFHNGEMLNADTAIPAGLKYTTKIKKRIVYGGGGITPDFFIPFDTSVFSATTSRLFYGQTFAKFIYQYYIRNRNYFKQFKTPTEFASKFQSSEDVWKQLIHYVASDSSLKLASISAKERFEIEQHIKVWLARQIWRMEGYFELNNLYDPVVQKALEAIKTGQQ